MTGIGRFASLLGAVVLAAAVPAVAQAADIDAGRQAWEDGGCGNCHGIKGQGGGGGDFPLGPSLRANPPDHDALVAVISCGVPGTQMPAWLKGAYTKIACNGAPLGVVPPGTMMTNAFSDQDIESLAAYILKDIEGK